MYNCGYLFSAYISFPLFIVLNVVIFVLLVVLSILRNPRGKINYLGLSLVAAGGFLNLAEMAREGCVKDSLSLLGSLYFNVFDIILMTGVIILTVGAFYEQKHSNS